MPKCTQDKIDFGRFGRRVIEADFSGGDLSSDGGLLLLRQVDEHLGLSRTAVGRDEALASAPTFSRLDNRATCAQAAVPIMLTELRLPTMTRLWADLAAQPNREGWPAAVRSRGKAVQ